MERSNGPQAVDPESSSPASPAPSSAGRKAKTGSKLTEWQAFFLERLEYLLGAQRDNRAADEAQSTLLSKAVYSTYLDCQSQGVGEQALRRISSSATTTPSAN